MVGYNLEERLLIIVKILYEDGKHFTVTLRKLRNQFSMHNQPSCVLLISLNKKFELISSLKDERDLTSHWPIRRKHRSYEWPCGSTSKHLRHRYQKTLIAARFIEFWDKFYLFMLTRFNWFNNCSLTSIGRAETLPTKARTNCKLTMKWKSSLVPS